RPVVFQRVEIAVHALEDRVGAAIAGDVREDRRGPDRVLRGEGPAGGFGAVVLVCMHLVIGGTDHAFQLVVRVEITERGRPPDLASGVLRPSALHNTQLV